MDNQEIPQSNEVVNHQARELFQEHLRIVALKKAAQQQRPLVGEGQHVISDRYESIIDAKQAQHLARAAEFTKKNLPRLRGQAIKEATLAGKRIVEPTEERLSPRFGQYFNAHRTREVLERMRQQGGDINPVIENNQQIIERYCEANGIDASKIPPQVMMKIKALPQWQDAEE